MRIQRTKSSGGVTLGVLGKVKVGEMTKNGNGNSYPKSLDYFRFTSNESHRIKAMNALLGEKPTSIAITFHSNNPDDVCMERLELRNSSGQLVAYGDGQVFHRSTKDGYVKEDARTFGVEKYMNGLAAKNSKSNYIAKWDEVLILRFIIVGCKELGVWEFRTKGKDTSIPQIVSSFDLINDQIAGRVSMIPFSLTIEKKKSNRAEVTRQYPVVQLICDLNVDKMEALQEYGGEITGLITNEKLSNYKPQLSTGNEDLDISEAQIVA